MRSLTACAAPLSALALKNCASRAASRFVRKGIMTFFHAMTRHLESGTLKELTLTTNGSQLERYADELYAAGVRRINISLDTLDEAKVRRYHPLGPSAPSSQRHRGRQKGRPARQDQHGCAQRLQRRRAFHLTEWCQREEMDLTFIEVMPMGDIGNEDRLDQYWPSKTCAQRWQSVTP